MGPSTKVSLRMDSSKGMEGSSTRMEMCTMENGRRTRQMGMECSLTQMGLSMKEAGERTSSMG